jgi:hypothetical protein
MRHQNRLPAPGFNSLNDQGIDVGAVEGRTAGLADLDYRTVCIGGVGFFSGQTKLGRVLPSLFHESHWSPDTSVDCPESTRHQVDIALRILEQQPPGQRLFLFLNIPATHTPTYRYLPGATEDSWDSQLAALAASDTELARLFAVLPTLGEWLIVMCADHGEAFGEDGHHGHGIAHPSVWNVPYAEALV